MGNCETCTKRNTCKKDIGIIFGGCRSDYVSNRPLMGNGKNLETKQTGGTKELWLEQ